MLALHHQEHLAGASLFISCLSDRQREFYVLDRKAFGEVAGMVVSWVSLSIYLVIYESFECSIPIQRDSGMTLVSFDRC